MSSPSTTSFCNACQRSPPEVILLLCTNCSQTTYCSRPCEAADQPTHQAICNRTPSPSPPDQDQTPFFTTPEPQETTHHLHLPLPLPLRIRIRNPHSRLLTNKFLHNLPQADVYTLLIDTYRLHLHEQTKYGPDLPHHHHQQTNNLSHFLSLASCRINPNPLLPPRWTQTSLNTLLTLSTGNPTTHISPDLLSPEAKSWLDLTQRPTISKDDIRNHYYTSYHQQQNHDVVNSQNKRQSGKGDFILQLRYLAQVIYGHPTTGGISFKPTIALLAEIEKRKSWVEDRRFWEYLRS
ncbi:hypothetical protein QBC40DRAFT_254047 [Triangularia verruculosa]|uniref:MYND-type domain-containing protein n=1 Tax=Triangularia verruculosa TaxID=2587418 RepID=A0AAN7ATD4_9PEZI|nr:hypothetical protein QBC40DRAFT_254047 [Triangularia verruculosa]